MKDQIAFPMMNSIIVGIGEVLWDLLPGGPQLGGAPSNFAFHARALGANAAVITRVGDDEPGRRVLKRFQELSLPVETVQIDPLAPTGTASVTLNHSGVPHFDFRKNVAWDRLTVTPDLLALVQSADALCFGSLAQRAPASRATIQCLLRAASPDALRIFDVNLRDGFHPLEVMAESLCLANVLKLNEDELVILAQLFSFEGSPRCQIQMLADRFKLKVVALTRGERGSLLYANGLWSEQKPQRVEVVDTVGAGDSFTAALALGLLGRMSLADIHAFANEVAGFVCSQRGATPPLPALLQNRCRPLTCAQAPGSSEIAGP